MLGVVAKGIEYVFVSENVAHSVAKTYETITNDDLSTGEKVVSVGSNLFDIGVHLLLNSGISTKMKTGGVVANAVMQEARSGGKEVLHSSSVQNITRMAGIVVVSSSDMLGRFVRRRPKFFSGLQKVKQIGEWMQEKSQLLVDRREAIEDEVRESKLGRLLRNHLQSVGEVSVEDGVFVHDFRKLDKSLEKQLRAFIQTPVEEMEAIPEFLYKDLVFSSRRDSSTQVPIRHVRTVKVDEGSQSCLYEKKTIKALLEKNEKPDSWPKGVPFEKERLEPFPYVQKNIDNHLIRLRQEAIEEFASEEDS